MILRRDVNRPLTHDEVDDNFVELKNDTISNKEDLIQASSKTLAEYPTLAAAMADDIPDGVVFLVNDGDDAGYWRRDTSNPEGAEFLREFPPTTAEFEDLKEQVSESSDFLLDFVTGKPVDYKISPELREGAYITSSGKLAESTSVWSATEEFIPLSEATSVVYSGRLGVSVTRLAFYSDKDEDSFIESHPSENREILYEEFQVPQGAEYVRVSCSTSFSDDFYLILKGYVYKPEQEEQEPVEIPLFDFRIVGSNIVYENETIKEADIIWNNGSSGRVVFDDWDADNATFRSFVATSIDDGVTVTQPPVTFDSSGQITDYPDLIINPL